MNYIVDDIGKVVELMRNDAEFNEEFNKDFAIGDGPPYYMYGHPVEVTQRLLRKDMDKAQRKQKYPLICLLMDTPESFDNNIVTYKLNIAIVEWTERTDIVDDRYAKVFKPTLYPLYKLFMEKLKESGLFFWPKMGNYPTHTKIDRPYWGTSSKQGNTATSFNDPLDAIEIIDLQIKQSVKTC